MPYIDNKYYHPRIQRPGVGKGMNPDAWGKTGDLSGAKNGRAKLTMAKVRKIRGLGAMGFLPHEIKKKMRLDVSTTQIGRILRRENWN